VNLKPYRDWVFDCDGVLLDSNRVKTDAFHDLAVVYSQAAADALVAHHQATGGVSRFEKVRWLHEELLDGPADEDAIARDIARYGELCREALTRCAVLPGVRAFLDALPAGSRRFVVSGGLESEVAHALDAHGLTFDGVHGSPTDKDTHFADLQRRGHLDDAVYFGDSRYDHVVAARFGVDFVFVDGVSEFADADAYFATHPILGRVPDFTALTVGR
jgi:phosphoglycolate phosphatase-like HAD superfamily hydrolase